VNDPRRGPLSHTDQLKTLTAEIALFEDRLRNARFSSRAARFLLAVAAFFTEGNRRLREALAVRLCPLCDGLDFPECAVCECPVPCPRCPQGADGGSP
jgi:hypothetical protein